MHVYPLVLLEMKLALLLNLVFLLHAFQLLDQHLQMAQMRALENSKPMLRATNNGLTAFIDYQGSLTSALPPFEEGELVGNIQPRTGHTPFTIWGSWPCIILCLILVAVAAQFKTSFNGKRG